MSHSHICCLVHVVFATAERRPGIEQEMQERLHSYLGRHRPRERNSRLSGGWCRRPRSFIAFHATDDFHVQSRPTAEIRVLEVGSREFSAVKELCVAGGIWSLLDRGLAKSDHSEIYPGPSGTSQTDQLRRRMEEIPCRARDGRIDSAVPAGLVRLSSPPRTGVLGYIQPSRLCRDSSLG
jgi:hypothetical protein